MSIIDPDRTKAPETSANSQILALLAFQVAGQRCGLPVTRVVRIIEMVAITRLPGAPDPIQGIINVRGKTAPVMDLRHRFGLPRPAYGLHTPIILVEVSDNGRLLGLIVDEVEDVLHLPAESLEMAQTIVPAELAGQMTAQTAHLVGVAKMDRQMILVLDVRALLSHLEQVTLSQALSSERPQQEK
jgi:purine-binding chemotaxis protein CheW